MNIVINEELKAYIEPLTQQEHEALERSLLAEGCRDALVLWGDVLVDGHNRYGICQKHGLPFRTIQSTLFRSLEDVHLWMIDQHLGRRSVSEFQRGVLALRKRDIVERRRSQALAAMSHKADASLEDGVADMADGEAMAHVPATPNLEHLTPLKTREDIAKAARLSTSQVVLIEKLQKQAAPELLGAVKTGVVSLNAAAAVATLPPSEQAEVVAAGAEQLRLAAKRVRESKRRPKEVGPEEGEGASTSPTELHALREQVARLMAENQALREEVALLRRASDGAVG